MTVSRALLFATFMVAAPFAAYGRSGACRACRVEAASVGRPAAL
jgi:hypothetical protein